MKDPLLHFFAAGALLFAAHAALTRDDAEPASGERTEIRVTAGDLEWLAGTWERQWQRPPSERELRDLVAGYVREEVLAREARALGLDRNDTVVRRRLAQKMEFLVRDTARVGEPTDDELRRLWDDDRERHRTLARVSFSQVPFESEAAARDGLAALAADPGADVGDGSMLERDHVLVDERAVSGLFGEELARRVFALDPGPWHGPIPSPYGFHLVRVAERVPARERAFEEVRGQVLDDWQRARQAEAEERQVAALFEKYDVVVEEDAASPVGPLAASSRTSRSRP